MKITSRKEVERGQKGKGKRQEKMRKKRKNARNEKLGVKEKKNNTKKQAGRMRIGKYLEENIEWKGDKLF